MALIAHGKVFETDIGECVFEIINVEGSKNVGWVGTVNIMAPNNELIQRVSFHVPYTPNPYQALEGAIRQSILDDQGPNPAGLGKRYSNPRVVPD